MLSLGYEDVARICLTHSFNQDKIEAYVGNFDASEEDTEMIRVNLKETVQDDYDKLIQLCDAIAGAEGVMDIVDRMNDVKSRYGSYDPDKWQTNLDLKEYFEKKMGIDLYVAVDKEKYKPYQPYTDFSLQVNTFMIKFVGIYKEIINKFETAFYISKVYLFC